MAPPHSNSSNRAAERRKQRRQRRAGQGTQAPSKSVASSTMAPLSLGNRRRGPRTVAATARALDPETEYRFVRRDLWRLLIYTAICFVLMIVVLFLIEG